MSTDPAITRSRYHRAFTLIEMLAVLGIVLVLAAVLFPAMKVAMDRAKVGQCVSNLKAIGGALHAYAADNNGRIMPRALKDAAGAERYWHAQLLNQGFLASPAVLFCPSFTPYNYKRAATMPAYDVYKATGQTYGMRLWVGPGKSWSTNEDPQSLSSIEKPSEFFLLADSYWDAWKAQGYTITPGDSGQRVHLRHNKLANTLFADGHVEAKDAQYFQVEVVEKQGGYGRNKAFQVWPEEQE